MTKESSLGAPTPLDRDKPRSGGAAERNEIIEEEIESLTRQFLVSPDTQEPDDTDTEISPTLGVTMEGVAETEQAEGGRASIGDTAPDFLQEWKKAQQEATPVALNADGQEQRTPNKEVAQPDTPETNTAPPTEAIVLETEFSSEQKQLAPSVAKAPRPVPGIDGVVLTPEQVEQRRRQLERRREKDSPSAGSRETKYDAMTYEELAGDPYAGPMLERRVFDFLKGDAGWNGSEYVSELTPDGYLVRADGTRSKEKPSMLVHGNKNISRLARMVKDDMRATERQMPVPQTVDPREEAPTQVAEEDDESALDNPTDESTDAAPAAETSGADVPLGSPEGSAREKDARAWNEARAQYMRYRRELIAARQEWEQAIEAHSEMRKSKGIAFFFDKKEVTDRVVQAEAAYDAVLQKFRTERASFAERFAAYAGGSEKTRERIAEYTALREAILDRRIDQDVEVVERMRMFGGQRESTNRFWEATKRFGRWYGAQPLGKKVLFGAGAGALVGGALAAGGAAATAGMVFGTAAASAARRAVGTLTGAKVGALMGGVKSTIDSAADRYQERTIQKLKRTFGEQDLSDARRQRVATRRNARLMKHAGTATAVGVTAGAAYIAGSNVAEALSSPEATVTSVQDVAPQAAPETAPEVLEPIASPAETVQESSPVASGEPGAEVSVEDPVSPVDGAQAEELSDSSTVTVEDTEAPSTQEAPIAAQKSPDDFTEPYVPPTETEAAQGVVVDVPTEDPVDQEGAPALFDGSEQEAGSVVEETQATTEPHQEDVPDTESLLRMIAQNMESDETKAFTHSPVPDDVPQHTEDINVSPEEPTPIYTVEKGGSIWRGLEQKLEARGAFEDLNEAQRIRLINNLKSEIAQLSKDDLQKMGIESGNVNRIGVGEKIDLSKVLRDESLEKAIADAKGLSEAKMNSIMEEQSGRPGASLRVAEANVSRTEFSGANLETTNQSPFTSVSSQVPPPFTSVSSQAPPPFTSVSSMEGIGEQAALGTEVRPGDFPRAQAYFENAMRSEGLRALNADASRSVLRHLFNEHRIFSTMIEGKQKLFDANWNAISTLTLNDVFNGDGKLTLDGGRIAAPISGAEAERIVRTFVTQAVEGVEAQGAENVRALFEQAQEENWSVGTFFDRMGTELETHAAANDTEHVATLASLGAEDVAVEDAEAPPTSPTSPDYQPSSAELSQAAAEAELSMSEKQHAIDTLKQIAKAHAPDDRPLSTVQQRLLTERAVKAYVQQYAAQEKLDLQTALERLNGVTGEYADANLGDADGVVEADEGNALRTFTEKNPGFKALQNLLIEHETSYVPKPSATLASLDGERVVEEGTTPSSTPQPEQPATQEQASSQTPTETLPPEQQHAFDTFNKIGRVQVPDDRALSGAQERLLIERAVKAYVNEYAAQEGINTATALERLNEMTGDYADRHFGDADGVVEADEGKALKTFTRKNPGFKVLQKMMDEQERPRRTEPLIEARFPMGPKEGLFGGKVDVGGEVGVRVGGGHRNHYVDVKLRDKIEITDRNFITNLKAHPEWSDATAEELIERDPAFEKAWRSYVGGEDDNGETLNNRWGRITQEGKARRIPGVRAAVDPRDIEQLKQMKGSEALRQLQDQLEEYEEKNTRRVPRRDIHIRVKPFKD